jgi:hypothetical protein
MSNHLGGLNLTRRGQADAAAPSYPPTLEPRKEATNLPTKEPSNLGEATPRKRPWDGQDNIVQANYDVPKRIQTKLHTLKAWDRIPNLKVFVAETLEKALDKEIAKAEKEGY